MYYTMRQDFDKVYAMCVENNFLSLATEEQINKLKMLWESNFSIYQCAVVIWMCSEDTYIADVNDKLLGIAYRR